MRNLCFKKVLVVGIIVLFLLVGIQPALALSKIKSDNNFKIESETERNFNKPDLIISDIYAKNTVQQLFEFWIQIKNIGWVSVYKQQINITINVKKIVFGSPPVDFREWHKTCSGIIDPGEVHNIQLSTSGFKPGIYIFKSVINPDKTIDEITYINNKRNEIVFSFALYWFTFRWFNWL